MPPQVGAVARLQALGLRHGSSGIYLGRAVVEGLGHLPSRSVPVRSVQLSVASAAAAAAAAAALSLQSESRAAV